MPYVYSFLGFLQLCFNSEPDEQGGASGLIQLIKGSKLGKGSSDSRRAENVRGKREESTQAYAHTYIHTHTHTHTYTQSPLLQQREQGEHEVLMGENPGTDLFKERQVSYKIKR